MYYFGEMNAYCAFQTSVLFKWRNGLPYLYTHWDQSKPTETPGQDCVLSHNNKWRDTSCNIRLPFLCEIIMSKKFPTDER